MFLLTTLAAVLITTGPTIILDEDDLDAQVIAAEDLEILNGQEILFDDPEEDIAAEDDFDVESEE